AARPARRSRRPCRSRKAPQLPPLQVTPRRAGGVALDAGERAAEDDLRDRAPDVGERRPELVVAHRRIRLPHQHRLVEPAAAQVAAKLACLRDMETKLLLAGGRPPERARAVGDKPSTETPIE